tara:strand:+ start:326 stop:523 length:198 start_codon:yes stop_codon:yes gene_type:complete
MRVIGFLVNEKVNKDDNASMRDRGEESEYGYEDDDEQQEEEDSEEKHEDESDDFDEEDWEQDANN